MDAWWTRFALTPQSPGGSRSATAGCLPQAYEPNIPPSLRISESIPRDVWLICKCMKKKVGNKIRLFSRDGATNHYEDDFLSRVISGGGGVIIPIVMVLGWQ